MGSFFFSRHVAVASHAGLGRFYIVMNIVKVNALPNNGESPKQAFEKLLGVHSKLNSSTDTLGHLLAQCGGIVNIDSAY